MVVGIMWSKIFQILSCVPHNVILLKGINSPFCFFGKERTSLTGRPQK